MLAEVFQVLRGAGKVGQAFANTQEEMLRLMACNSTLGTGVKAAQEVVEGVMGTVMGGTAMVCSNGREGGPFCTHQIDIRILETLSQFNVLFSF